MRKPVAAKLALAMAGVMAINGVSATASRRDVPVIDYLHIDLRHVFEPRHPVRGKTIGQDPAVGESHRLKQVPARSPS